MKITSKGMQYRNNETVLCLRHWHFTR